MSEVFAALDEDTLNCRRCLASFNWIFQEIETNLIEELIAERSVFGLRKNGGIVGMVF